MFGIKQVNFQALVEGRCAGTIVHRDGEIFFANQAFADILAARGPDALVSRSEPDAWIAPDDRKRLRKRYEKILDGETPSKRYEFRVLRHDGTEAWVEAFDHPIEWAGTECIHSLVLDISLRKTYVETLCHREAQFRALADHSTQGILIYRDDKPLFANQALAGMLGFNNASEILAVPSIAELQSPSEREKLRRHGKACLRGKEAPPKYETEVLRKDGSTTKLDCWVSATDWEGTRAVQVLFSEISDRLKSRAAVEESRARFQDFAELASDWFWETDQDLKFTRINGASNSDKPISTSSLIGRTLLETRMPEDPEGEKWDALQSDLSARRPINAFQFPTRDPDGSIRQIRASGKPVVDAAGDFAGYRGVFSDVTDLVAIKEDAANARQLLTAAIEAMPDAFVVYDAQDRLVICNRNFRNGMFEGIADMIVPGANFADLMSAALERGLVQVPDGDKDAFLRECIAHHREGKGEWEMVGADGRYVVARERRMSDGGAIGIRTDITKRRRAEDSLRAGEQRFRDYAEMSGEWYWETDTAHRFSFRSDGISDVGTQIGKTWFDLKLAEDDDAEKWAAHRANLDASLPFRDFRYIQRDDQGQIRHLSVTGRPMFAADGSFVGYHGTGRDVTDEVNAQNALNALRHELERRIEELTQKKAAELDEMRRTHAAKVEALSQAHAALGARERQFRDMLATTGHGVAITVGDKPVFANPVLAEILGFDNANEFLAVDSISALFQPNDVTPPAGDAGASQNTEIASVVGECRARRKDGSTAWLETRSGPIDWDGATATAITCVDVTERRLAREALEESEHRLSRHLAETPLAATIWDADLVCTTWNRSAAKLFGYSEDEVSGNRPIDMVVPEAGRGAFQDILHAVAEQRRERQCRIENVTKDDRAITCEWSVTPLMNENGTLLAIASFIRDVSDEVREIEKLRAERTAADEPSGPWRRVLPN
jgi:PAS domain S-box-containing protein